MAKALSVDLHRRVVDAANSRAACRHAATRLGVRVSSAIRCVARSSQRGHLVPDKRGGDLHSHRIAAHAPLILGWITEEPNLTLAVIAERCSAEVGQRPLPSLVCWFFQRHGLTQNYLVMQVSQTGRTS